MINLKKPTLFSRIKKFRRENRNISHKILATRPEIISEVAGPDYRL
jgi:hypothetical protein